MSSPFLLWRLSSPLFHTRDLLKILKNLAMKQIGIEEKETQPLDSIRQIQGIDDTVAERFADEGITTVEQLAYADRSTSRSGLDFHSKCYSTGSAKLWHGCT